MTEELCACARGLMQGGVQGDVTANLYTDVTANLRSVVPTAFPHETWCGGEENPYDSFVTK